MSYIIKVTNSKHCHQHLSQRGESPCKFLDMVLLEKESGQFCYLLRCSLLFVKFKVLLRNTHSEPHLFLKQLFIKHLQYAGNKTMDKKDKLLILVELTIKWGKRKQRKEGRKEKKKGRKEGRRHLWIVINTEKQIRKCDRE